MLATAKSIAPAKRNNVGSCEARACISANSAKQVRATAGDIARFVAASFQTIVSGVNYHETPSNLIGVDNAGPRNTCTGSRLSQLG